MGALVKKALQFLALDKEVRAELFGASTKWTDDRSIEPFPALASDSSSSTKSCVSAG